MPGMRLSAEIVGKHPLRLNQAWQEILAKISFSQPVPLPQRLDQHIGREDVVSHRGEGARRITGHRRRVDRLLTEAEYAPVFVGVNDAERRGFSDGNRQRGDTDVGMAAQVKINHLAHVHAIDMVGTKHHDEVRRKLFDQPQVLIDGIGSALEPFRSLAHLRWNHRDELLGEDRRQQPGTTDVLDQRLRLVLDQQVDGENLRVDQVGENKVNDAKTAAERYRWLRTMLGQWVQTGAFTARQNESKNIGRNHHLLVSL